MSATRVAGKIAVVTGGASGIGAAIVQRLAGDGASVLIADIDLTGAERHANAVTALGGDVTAYDVDITSQTAVARFAATIEQRHGRVDILVNNAALTDPLHQARDGDVSQMPLEVWNRTIEVDLTGAMLMCRALLPLMTDGGSIVNITSNAGLAGDTSLTAYAVAKAALNQLTRSIATAFGRRGVRCNAVSPAHIASPSFAANVAPQVAAMLEANCLLPRLGRVEDVAAAVLFLASDESSMITGETLCVDGGALAHLPTYADQQDFCGDRTVRQHVDPMSEHDDGTDAADEERLIGSYRLLQFRDIADDGEVREPLGAEPIGFITYTPERLMTAVLMAAGRPNFAVGDVLTGTDDERIRAFSTASAYAGRWSIEDGAVVHRLEAGTFPNWTGTEQRRPFELVGDELRLYPPRLLMDGKMRRSELVWRRVTR